MRWRALDVGVDVGVRSPSVVCLWVGRCCGLVAARATEPPLAKNEARMCAACCTPEGARRCAAAGANTLVARVRAAPDAHADWDTRRVQEVLREMKYEENPSTRPSPPPSQKDREANYGQPVPKAVVAERPTWLPANKYLHEGKEVVKISGSAVYGCRSTIHYADGSIQTQSSGNKSTYSKLDGLIKQFGFITYKSFNHERYYAGERFEAVPVEDPSEWEEIPRGTPGIVSGWIRKKHTRFRTSRERDVEARVRVYPFFGRGVSNFLPSPNCTPLVHPRCLQSGCLSRTRQSLN